MMRNGGGVEGGISVYEWANEQTYHSSMLGSIRNSGLRQG